MDAFSRWISLMALSSLAACGGTQSKAEAAPGPAASGEQGGIDVQAMLARESAGLTPRRLAAQGIRAEVLSASEPKVVVEDKLAKVVIPIGAEADVQCLIYE